jgi:hypothetical protein
VHSAYWPHRHLDLSCLVNKDGIPAAALGQLRRVPTARPDHFPVAALRAATTFEASQIEALKAMLYQRVSLIQGPPGTGKASPLADIVFSQIVAILICLWSGDVVSYIVCGLKSLSRPGMQTFMGVKAVEVLIKNLRPPERLAELGFEGEEGPLVFRGRGGRGRGRERARPPRAPQELRRDMLPILCVCLTNHALDQFLEALLDAGITGIVRVGGGSKSERMQDLNLRNGACAGWCAAWARNSVCLHVCGLRVPRGSTRPVEDEGSQSLTKAECVGCLSVICSCSGRGGNAQCRSAGSLPSCTRSATACARSSRA